jgi:hypothetical protein
MQEGLEQGALAFLGKPFPEDQCWRPCGALKTDGYGEFDSGP